MFKIKLITSEEVSKLMKQQRQLSFISIVLFGGGVGIFMSSAWLGAILVLLAIIIFIWMLTVLMQIKTKRLNGQLEINEHELKINSKKGLQEIINLDNIEKITVQENYKVLSDIGSIPSYLIIHQKGTERKLNFEFETEYMITQLNKVIESWKNRGIQIEWT